MDSMAEEQIDYEEEEYGGAPKMQYQRGGAIPALADEELMGEDDEYDDLYNDVNIGDGLLQFQQPEAPPPSTGVGNGGLQAQKTGVPEQRVQAGGSQGLNIPEVSVEGKYTNAGSHFPAQNDGQVAVNRPNMGSSSYPDGASVSQKVSVQEMTHDVQVRNMGFQGLTSGPPRTGVNPSNTPGRVANEPAPMLNPGAAGPQGTLIPSNQMGVNANVNRPMVNENLIRPPLENCGTMLFVGELHWWTTDAELESILSQYGRVKEIKFFDERASGKSKGYCQVEFHDAAAAAACKDGMNGYIFNGRACVVAFASPQTLKQMGASYMNKNQGQPQSQPQGRRPMNDGGGRGGNMNYQSGEGGRNYGRGGWGRGGQGVPNRGLGGGAMRGRGPMGAKNMLGSGSGAGSGAGGGGYGQGLAGPGFGGPAVGMMHPHNMMGGFDPTYMGRGGGYGGFSGPGFPGMLPSFPAVTAMGLAGVAPHVNPAFFNRGMAANGMGMMGSSGMDGPHPGMWTDSSMGGWGGEEHGRRTRESSFGGDDGASDFGYGEANHEKGARSSAASREKERGSERDFSGSTDRRHREEREQDWERSERDHRHREEKDGYRDHRQRDRDSAHDDDWDRGQSSSRSRSRSRAMPDEDHKSRSRDVDYGKRRRLPSE